jgi:hypothetical protein
MPTKEPRWFGAINQRQKDGIPKSGIRKFGILFYTLVGTKKAPVIPGPFLNT